MENISIKVLDALFDLCDGDNYVILDRQDFLARIADHTFATDELTEILESLAVDAFIDLKYADNQEFCIAMKTKGRTLIKQAREKMQHILRETPARAAAPKAEEMPFVDGQAPTEQDLSDASIPMSGSTVLDDYVSNPDGKYASAPISGERDPHYYDSNRQARGYAVPPSSEDQEKDPKRIERGAFLWGAIGAAVGAFVINLIFLIIILARLAS